MVLEIPGLVSSPYYIDMDYPKLISPPKVWVVRISGISALLGKTELDWGIACKAYICSNLTQLLLHPMSHPLYPKS